MNCDAPNYTPSTPNHALDCVGGDSKEWVGWGEKGEGKTGQRVRCNWGEVLAAAVGSRSIPTDFSPFHHCTSLDLVQKSKVWFLAPTTLPHPLFSSFLYPPPPPRSPFLYPSPSPRPLRICLINVHPTY